MKGLYRRLVLSALNNTIDYLTPADLFTFEKIYHIKFDSFFPGEVEEKILQIDSVCDSILDAQKFIRWYNTRYPENKYTCLVEVEIYGKTWIQAKEKLLAGIYHLNGSSIKRIPEMNGSSL